MHRSWTPVIKPLLEAAKPRVVVEIGAGRGALTGKLLRYCEEAGAVLHAIDPEPSFDVDLWRRKHGERLVFHHAPSLEALQRIHRIDLALIDGDPNWYTVFHELDLLRRDAEAAGRPLPIVLVHHVAWPYGRRDMYHEPDRIPDEYRQAYARRGVMPGTGELDSHGLGENVRHAIYEHDLRNGVRTAVEDFVSELTSSPELVEVPGMQGLGVLVPLERLAASSKLRSLVRRLRSREFIAERCAAIDDARVRAEISLEHVTRARDEANERARTRQQEAATERSLRETAQEGLRLAREARADLERRLSEAQQTLASSQAERAALDQRAAELADQLEQGRAQRDALERDLAERAARLNELDTRSEELEAKISDAQRTLAATKAERDDLERRAAEQAGQLESGQAQRDALARDLAARDARLDELEARREELEAGLSDAQRTLVATKAERDDLERGAAEHAAQLDRLRTELEREAEARREIEARLAERERALEAAESDRHALDQRMSHRESKFVAEREQLEGRIHSLEKAIDFGGAQRARRAQSVDVVVVARGGQAEMRRCLSTILQKTNSPFRLILVEDGTDAERAAFVETFAAEHDSVAVVADDSPPDRRAVATTLGLRASDADYVVVLDPAAIISFGWLDRLLECAESDPSIGIVCPFSDAGLPEWLGVDGMALLVDRLSTRTRQQVPVVEGPCYAIKRSVLESIGSVDEEADDAGADLEHALASAATRPGLRLVMADDTYVHCPAGQRPSGASARSGIGEAIAQALTTPAALTQALRSSWGHPPSVTFVVGTPYGIASEALTSAYCSARTLHNVGVNARVAVAGVNWPRARHAYGSGDGMLFPFDSATDLLDQIGPGSIAVAMGVASLPLVASLATGGDGIVSACCMQGDEVPPVAEPPAGKENGSGTHRPLEGQLLYTRAGWICDQLRESHDVFVAKVEPIVDDSLFFPPRERTETAGTVRLAAALAPSRARFGALAALSRLQEAFANELDVTTFGCAHEELAADGNGLATGLRHLGLLDARQRAALLSRQDLFLELAGGRGTGHAGLEAMACGCAAVLPSRGTPSEFVTHDIDALLVDTIDADAVFEAVGSLIRDRPRRDRLAANARRTASRHASLRAALSEYAFLHQECEKRGVVTDGGETAPSARRAR